MKIFLFIYIFFFLSCKESPSNAVESQSFYNSPKDTILPEDIETITPEEAQTFHKNKSYEYEYRTGHSGAYEYNYDVIGYDENGNEVAGNINISGKYGAGKIEDKNGNELDINVEWYDHGKLKGEDENGTTYELTVE